MLRHAAVSDPLPDGEFDLIHARLVFNAVPNAASVLRRLISSLAPGGWLVVEEFDSESTLPDPANHAAEQYLPTHQATARLMTESGFDRRYGRRLFDQLRTIGLQNVTAEARLIMCHGGSAGTQLLRANFEQLRDSLLQRGYVTETQFASDIAALGQPSLVLPSSMMWSARGCRS